MSVVKLKACSADLVCRSPLQPGSEVKDIDADKISNRLVTSSYSVSEPFAANNRILSRNSFLVAGRNTIDSKSLGFANAEEIVFKPNEVSRPVIFALRGKAARVENLCYTRQFFLRLV